MINGGTYDRLKKRTPSNEQMEEYWRRARQWGSVEEILSKNGPLSFLFKDTIETMLKEEMTDHLGYEHNDARSKKTDNSRNGHYHKKLKTDSGFESVKIGIFEPPCI